MCPPRSLLFVPGDSERKLAKSVDFTADAKVDHPSERIKFNEELSALEAQAGIASGTTRLIPLLENPRAVLTAADYLRTPRERLSGISWGAEDLGAALGVRSLREANGAVLSYATGFSGKLAIHSDQVSVINGVFLASPTELDSRRLLGGQGAN